VVVVDQSGDAFGGVVADPGYIEFPDPGAHFDESGEVEGLEADLGLTGVVEAGVTVESHPDPLVERGQSLDALASLEEGGGAGDEQVHPGIAWSRARRSTGGGR